MKVVQRVPVKIVWDDGAGHAACRPACRSRSQFTSYMRRAPASAPDRGSSRRPRAPRSRAAAAHLSSAPSSSRSASYARYRDRDGRASRGPAREAAGARRSRCRRLQRQRGRQPLRRAVRRSPSAAGCSRCTSGYEHHVVQLLAAADRPRVSVGARRAPPSTSRGRAPTITIARGSTPRTRTAEAYMRVLEARAGAEVAHRSVGRYRSAGSSAPSSCAGRHATRTSTCCASGRRRPPRIRSRVARRHRSRARSPRSSSDRPPRRRRESISTTICRRRRRSRWRSTAAQAHARSARGPSSRRAREDRRRGRSAAPPRRRYFPDIGAVAAWQHSTGVQPFQPANEGLSACAWRGTCGTGARPTAVRGGRARPRRARRSAPARSSSR